MTQILPLAAAKLEEASEVMSAPTYHAGRTIGPPKARRVAEQVVSKIRSPTQSCICIPDDRPDSRKSPGFSSNEQHA